MTALNPAQTNTETESMTATDTTHTTLIAHMAALQEDLNRAIHPEWRKQHFDWRRAIWTECAELLEHLGWKWWKHHPRNFDQARLEVVDIWHFVLSEALQNAKLEHIAQNTYEWFGDTWWASVDMPDDIDIVEAVEELVSQSLTAYPNWHQLIYQFWIVVRALGMDLSQLYRLYLGKHILNRFRQDHGYHKPGHYLKVWNGREDNEYLTDILTAVPEGQLIEPNAVRAQLEGLYHRHARSL